MRFGIPTYKRADKADTIWTLKQLDYTKNEIIVQTQTEDDFNAYKQIYGDAATFFCKTDAYNCPTNRNNTLDHFNIGEDFILIDDDVKAFCRLDGEAKKNGRLVSIECREELDALFKSMFAYAKRNNSPLWSWYPVANAFFMKKSVDKKNLLEGTIIGFAHYGLRFDSDMYVKEDYELGLRMIKNGYNAVRFNGYTVKARHYSAGGCEDTWRTNEECCKKLLQKYPEFIRKSHRKGEVRYVGPR